MKSINKLLVPAEEALKASRIVDNNGFLTDAALVADIAGFGAIVINLDLLPALAVYKEDEKRKIKVLDALAKTLNPQEGSDTLFEKAKRVEGNLAAKRLLKERILDASIALKLMVRTYKKPI